jgi:parallel beta-helix repeat protein
MFSGSRIIRRGLLLLVAAVALALGASSALAAAKPPARPAGPRTGRLLKPAGTHFAKASARRSKARAAAVHTITSCGYVASSPGTYSVTTNLTDSGSGPCIEITANNVTVNLNSHTITGTGTDTCIEMYYNTRTNYETSGDSVIGGAKGSPRANLQGCGYGLYVYFTSGATASRINIHRPTSYGIEEEYAAGANLSQITVYAPSGSAYGFYGYGGAGNTLSHVSVDMNNSEYGFYTEYEYADTFAGDVVFDSYSSTGDAGTGFYDLYSNRNTYSGDKALGQEYGFYFYEDSYGTVTAKGNTAYDKSSNEYGFYVYYAELRYDYSPPNHTVISGNTTTGYDYGFYDESDDAYSTQETYDSNTADNYSEYGFYFYYPTDYTITNNTADANPMGTTKPRWVSGTYGFYFYEGYSYYAPITLSGNKSYDNEWGYYSDGYALSGTNNIAKRDKYRSYDVQYNS